jgi:hypothetical protein
MFCALTISTCPCVFAEAEGKKVRKETTTVHPKELIPMDFS